MPHATVSFRDDAAVTDAALAALREEAGLPDAFPDAVLADAEEAAGAWRPDGERCELPFVTVDPPGARDLDQALHIARRDGGHRVTYAIADVAAFVAPGGAIDREAQARAVTAYLPGAKVPLHPPVLSEGAASLLPDAERPAVVWTLDLDEEGRLQRTDVRRAVVRSTAQHTYADVPDEVATLLAEVGRRRRALERERGGVSLRLPEQEVERLPDGRLALALRAPLATEEDNAQLSLLTGMAAAQLVLRGGAAAGGAPGRTPVRAGAAAGGGLPPLGLLRTQSPPDPEDLGALRVAAQALGAPWPQDVPYPEWVRGLDPARPAHAALLQQAAGLGRGAGYAVVDGPPAEVPAHVAIAAPYAHVTAPLRRLADRHVLECCLAHHAGRPVPDWARAALPALPDAMAAGARRAGRAERAAVDLAEALLLAGREGERFAAVALDDRTVLLHDPPVRARVEGRLTAGREVEVVLETAAPEDRRVVLRPA